MGDAHEQIRVERSLLTTIATLPKRSATRSLLTNMSKEERDFAYITTEVYKEPDKRRSKLRGYTLLEGTTDRDNGSVTINDLRWAVYRADNGINYILVFRGTNNMEDGTHCMQLLLGGKGEHEYTMQAAIWAHRVMLSLFKQRDQRSGDGRNLVFQVAGHSLGGTVAMGVSLLLYDVLAIRDRPEPDGGPLAWRLYNDFLTHIARPWEDAAVLSENRLYKIYGGHIFNPGCFPRDLTAVQGDTDDFSSTDSSFMVGAILATIGNFGKDIIDQLASSDGETPDKRITTYHIFGDFLSCSFALGTQKNYRSKHPWISWLSMTAEWGAHSMANFLEDDSG